MKARNIIKKGNTYYSDFRNENGKRVRRSLGKDLTQAKIRVLQMMADSTVQSETPGVPSAVTNKKKSYISAVNEFMLSDPLYRTVDAWTKQRWDNTTECQAHTVLTCLKRFQAHSKIINVKSVTLPQMKQFITDRSQLVKNDTVNKNIQFLKKFFGWCEDMDYVHKSEARKLKKYPPGSNEPYNCTEEEVKQIIASGGVFAPLYILGLSTGMRGCEMFSLTQDDFLVKNDTMFIDKFSDKTGLKMNFPLTAEARKVIEESSHKIFPNAGEAMWHKALLSNLKSTFHPSFARKWKIRVHTLRHTFTMRGARAGIPKEVMQQLLGHKKVTTTEKYYRDLPQENLVEALERMPDLPK